MADSEDLKRLESGELDLSRCDFREAQLSGLDLRGRNFSHCLFDKAQCENTNFDGSDFQGAKVNFMNAKNATFDDCKLEKLHFAYTDLSGASFRNAAANGAIFQHAELNGANLQGTQIRDGSMDADTVLKSVIADKRSDFEGLKVLRATSRDPLFKDYTFSNGQLFRKAAVANPEDSDAPSNEYSSANLRTPEGQKIIAAKKQIPHLLKNAALTRLTAQQFASQIENALHKVQPTNGNELAEPLQTMLEFAEVLRNLAPNTQLLTEPLDNAQLVERIKELEKLVERLTSQLADETRAREAAEALAASDGFMAHFRKSAGKAAGNLAVAFVATGIIAATEYFLGLEHPFLTAVNRSLCK